MNKEIEKSKSAQREEEILKFWKENKIFEKSLEKKSPKGEFVFYDGPVTANSKPVLHTMEPFSFKDVIPRYKTMRGYHVNRKGGWDTHGLPVELQVEKKLGLNSKKAIEDYGIAKFNRKCKESVWEYIELWKAFTNRMGYWADQENPYVTCHNNYIESVWNVIKETDKQKLLYKDYKVVPWCPRCQTTLSSHELAQGYKDVKDLSVTAKFKVIGKENTYILAWTTTPWTLPGNVALAVGEKIDYVEIKKSSLTSFSGTRAGGHDLPKLGYTYIVAKNIFLKEAIRSDIKNSELYYFHEKDSLFEIAKELKGKDLVGLEYEPLYPYLRKQLEEKGEDISKAFKVYSADFVNTEDGTGIVHTAVMYGVDDFELGTKVGLPKHHLVGLNGKFLTGTDFLENRSVRDEEVAVDIIKDLARRGLLFKKERYEHSYPHCWRCKTALIYYARDSWYIRMSSLRDKLVQENKGIKWEPSHIKEGRFGKWLRGVKDWAISRERYWGTPLPIWICNKCEKKEVIGSIADLKLRTKKSGNKYFVMRHGEAENNVKRILNSNNNKEFHLTQLGHQQVEKEINSYKNVKFDYIFSSPIIRTKETAEIVKKELSFFEEIIFDNRITEVNAGDFDGKSALEYHEALPSNLDQFTKSHFNNESNNDVKKRVGNFLDELELKYKNKNILIISHMLPIWMMYSVLNGMDPKQTIESSEDNYFKNAEICELNFSPLPHNEDYELDLHKPFIDELELVCECGGNLIREKEVMDVWLDSGAMPFAQSHYPFEDKKIAYPADFISEAIDQTRGWFYTLHAVGILMGRGKAYKNVICLGHVLDANGKKMSKSVGNVVDPWLMMDKYGVDTLRLWMYSVNQPGESKSFDEKVVLELHNKVFNLLYNVLAFYELYRDKKIEKEEYKNSENILDKWIVSRLGELTKNVTDNMENYKLLEPVRDIRDFINDLSTWYVRRSRERLKNGDKEAKKTLYFVLKNLIKLMAPFAPFTAEDVWQKLKTDNDEESIHLVSWPEVMNIDKNIIKEMKEVRDVVTLGLKERQKAGIPVRQPLNKIDLSKDFSKKYIDIIKEELNIKSAEYSLKKDNELYNINLDTFITPELKTEGNYRELVRAIQDLRKKKELNPNDIINLEIETGTDEQKFINKFKDELLKTVGAKEINIKENEGEEIKIDELIFKIKII